MESMEQYQFSVYYVPFCIGVLTAFLLSVASTLRHSEQKRIIKEEVHKCNRQGKSTNDDVIVFTKEGKIVDEREDEYLTEYERNLFETVDAEFSKNHESKYMHMTDKHGNYKNTFLIVKKKDDQIIVGTVS